MKKNKKALILALLFLLVSAVIFLSVKVNKEYDQAVKEQESAAEPVIRDKAELQKLVQLEQQYDIIKGDDNAAVTIIEYASYSCSHCGDFYKNIYPKLKENYIDKGKVKIIFRDFPLDEPSLRASQLVHCASDGQDKLMKLLYEKQTVWAYSKDFPEKLENFAKIYGLTSAEFYQCITDKKLEENLLQKRIDAYEAYHINSTPSLIINGQLYIGVKNWYDISEYIENLLNK